MGTAAGNTDPQFLTETARQHLRETFFTRRAALTSVNFAVAETGEFVVCTNKGHADMGTPGRPKRWAQLPYPISGPIGAILAPNLDMEKYADLPFASTFAGRAQTCAQ